MWNATEKASEFLDFHLKRVTQNGISYFKDSNDFIINVKNIDFPNVTVLVTADVAWLCPNISHGAGFRKRKYEEMRTENLIKIA